MQFCVIGLGRFGISIALTLSEKGHEVLVIDKNEAKVQEIEEKVSKALVMDATNEKALRTVGMDGFDCVIVAITKDIEASILTTLLVKEVGAKKVISKAGSEVHAKILKRVGADKVVFPEREMGQKVAESLASPKIFDYIELSPVHSIVELIAPEPFEGKTLRETEARSKYGVHIIAIKRKVPEMRKDGSMSFKEEIIIAPHPDEEILKGDLLVLLGNTKDIEKLKKL